MSDVCVITGGGSGMGLSAAMQMPKEKIIIVSGRTVANPDFYFLRIPSGGTKGWYRGLYHQLRIILPVGCLL